MRFLKRLLATAAATTTVTMAMFGASASAQTPGKVQVLWLGQAAVRITSTTGKVIVIDPFLTANPKTPEGFKQLGALGKVDLILVTHGHADHMLDVPALAALTKAPVWGPAGLSQSMATLGLVPPAQANRMNKGGVITPLGPNIKITMTRAEHSSELVWKNPATGKDETHVGGEPAGFIVELENGFKIWHMGDTGLFGDMTMISQYYKPDLILIPIGGGPFVMNPADAAVATRDLIKPKFALPFHYGTFPPLKGTPEEYVQALGKTPTTVISIKPGEAVEF